MMSSAARTELSDMSCSSTISPLRIFFSTAFSMAAVSWVAQSRGSTDQPKIARFRAWATWRTASEQHPPGGRRKAGTQPLGSRAWDRSSSSAMSRRLIFFMFLWL